MYTCHGEIARSNAAESAVISELFDCFLNNSRTTLYVANTVRIDNITDGSRMGILFRPNTDTKGTTSNRYVDRLQSSYARWEMSGNVPYSSTPVFDTEYAL